MGDPTRLRNNRSGIVHLAVNGDAGCQTRTNPAAYTPTTDPVTCRHCLKQTAATAALTRRAADEAAVVRDLADTRSALADAEMRYSFHSGFLSALHSMRDVLAAAGTDPDVWVTAFHSSILTAAERTELADAAGAMMRRRRLPATAAPPARDGDVCPPWCDRGDAGHVLHSRRVAVLDTVAVSIYAAFNADPYVCLSLWSPDVAAPPARMSPQAAHTLGQVLAVRDADLSRTLTEAADIAGGAQ
ncbi:hypothetical protein GCM10017673_34050 [Streptosporangium violaceochromogenes]|nr:hypothetical protein GCM10017673_34050 [Streptosporangium violaceochromogenes]